MHARAHQDRAGTGIADAGNSSVVLLLVQGRRRRAAMLSLPAPAVVAGRTLAEQQSNDQWRRGRRCGRRGPDRSGFAGRHATDADADAVNGKQLLPGVTTHHCLIRLSPTIPPIQLPPNILFTIFYYLPPKDSSPYNSFSPTIPPISIPSIYYHSLTNYLFIVFEF